MKTGLLSDLPEMVVCLLLSSDDAYEAYIGVTSIASPQRLTVRRNSPALSLSRLGVLVTNTRSQ